MRFVSPIIAAVLDFFFPPECLGCGAENAWICANCITKIRLEVGRLSLQKKPFAHLWVMADYHQPLVARAIRRLKFGYCRDILRDLQPLFVAALEQIHFPQNATLVPVPLHRLRLNNRGFNQAALFAEQIAALSELPIHTLLRRTRHTPPQAQLSADERKENLKGAFCIDDFIAKDIPKNTPIVLVDDVATTLTTLEECARTLKKAGFTNLNALVIARSSEVG